MKFRSRLRSLFVRRQLDADMSEEMRLHLEQRTDENIAAGMSPEDARHAALRKFGGVEQAKEIARDQRGFLWLEQAGQDLRYALRALRKQPGFAATVVLTLALGVGANTAIFSVVNAVLLRSLPYREPAQVMRVLGTNQGGFRGATTAPDFVDWRDQAKSFQAMAATIGRSYNLSGQSEPERLIGTRASANYFEVLGVAPLLGRTFTAEEDRAGGAPVTLLGHGLWQRRFAGDPGVIGRAVVLDGVPHTVIGVLPGALELTATSAQVWTPLALTAQELRSTGNRRVSVTARLRAGVTRERAEAEMQTIATQIEAKRPNSNKGWRAAVVPVDDALVGDVRRPLFILLGAVGFVLLIACANVASLLLARGEARQQELAVRAALGAGRGRIARQLLTESLLLALFGGGLGLGLAQWGVDGLLWLLPANLPRLGQVAIDGSVLAFTAGVVTLTGIGFGLAPSLRAAKSGMNDALKRGGRSSAGASQVRRGLVVTEIALALVLLIGAGLLASSFWRMQSVDTGMRDQPVLSLQMALPESRYPEPVQIGRFFETVLERLATTPDVQSAGLTSNVPLGGGGANISVTVLGRPPVPPQQLPMAFYRAASPVYFATLGVPLVAGRGLSAQDRPGGSRVAVINQTMARKLWPDENPLGQQFTVDDSDQTPIAVVGIVGDVRHFGPTADTQPEFFVPFTQANASFWRFNARSLSLVVSPRGETAAALAAIRREIWAVDGELPLYRVVTLQQLRRDAVAMPRVYGALLGGFALAALLLAAIGIYGVISYTVAQRQREIGVRLALGASRRDVLQLVVGDGARLAVLGVVLGLLGALGLTRLIASQLYEVSATDPKIFGGLAALLIAIALFACWLPARRAAKTDPMVALRAE